MDKPELQIGTTFSVDYAKWLAGDWGGPVAGPPWQQSLKTILTYGLSPIRLAVPWNSIELEPGKYDFAVLDEMIEICHQQDSKIILCLGVKSPRWPEVHLPAFYRHFIAGRSRPFSRRLKLDNGLDAVLNRFLAVMANRYGDDERVNWFQIENEPLEPFGDPALAVPYAFLAKEIELVQAITDKPLLVTFGAGLTGDFRLMRHRRQQILDQLSALPVDAIGLDLYVSGFVNYGRLTGQFKASDVHWKIAKGFIEQIKAAGKEPMITELQFEPWEADIAKIDMKNAAGNKSLAPPDLDAVWQAAVELEVSTILVWGLEFQVACAKSGNDQWLTKTARLISRR